MDIPRFLQCYCLEIIAKYILICSFRPLDCFNYVSKFCSSRYFDLYSSGSAPKPTSTNHWNKHNTELLVNRPLEKPANKGVCCWHIRAHYAFEDGLSFVG